MKQDLKAKTVYNFRNTCDNCFNDIDLPFLSDFGYGEMIFQTIDGHDFCVAELIDNKTLSFIISVINSDEELQDKKIDPKLILTQLADKIFDKEFTTDYPICPNCKKGLRHVVDNNRTSQKHLPFASWTNFENLTPSDKLEQIKKAIVY